MTNELEKKFFQCFEIKPLIKNIPCSECEFKLEECGCFYCDREIYPQITDRILLELIVISLEYLYPYAKNTGVEEFKEDVLETLIFHKDLFRQQVRKLFKEVDLNDRQS